MKKPYNRIGILGGLGAMAGVKFNENLVKEYQSRGIFSDNDFPEVILYSISPKGLSLDGVGDEDILKKELIRGIKLLNKCKVDVIVIACNTVHLYYPILKQVSKSKILNMIKSAIPDCPYGVIGSRTTRETNLYGGIQVTEEQQKILDDAVANVICGHIKKSDKVKVRKIISSLFMRGAKKVIIGCTELPLISPQGENIIDAGLEIIKKL